MELIKGKTYYMKYFFIVNFGDRAHCTQKILDKIKEIFEAQKKEFFIAKSTSIEESNSLVDRAAREGFDTLLIGGGDGTINSVLNAAFGKPLMLGFVPMGSLNCMARFLKTPIDPVKAVEEIITNYKPRPFNVGRINHKYFLAFASIGYDASICHNIDKKTKIRFKKHGFIYTGIKNLRELARLPEFDVFVDGVRIDKKAQTLIVSSIPNYADKNIFDVSPFTKKMQGVAIKKNSILDYLKIFALIMLAPGKLKNQINDLGCFFDFNNLTILSDKRLYLQIDGEAVSLGDDFSYEISVIENGINVLCPPEKRE